MRAADLEVGLDCFSPALTRLVGQDLAALAPLADWTKLMVYGHARGPATLPYEIGALADWLAATGDFSKAFFIVSEFAYGSCRWWYQLDAIIQQMLRKPLKSRDYDIHVLLVIGLYQLQHMRVPEHAAVAETAGAARALRKKWAVAVINGVLRRFQRERGALLESLQNSDSFRYSQPQWFIERLRKDWPDNWQQLLEGLQQRPPFTIRVNLQRVTIKQYIERLVEMGITARPVKGVPSALVLDQAVAVNALPGFEQGHVSIQDAGAQLAAQIMKPVDGSSILDACAAPGGKTGHLLEIAPAIQLTAMDVDELRLEKVAENVRRLDYPVKLVTGDAAKPQGEWAELQYDQILLDVPCSATGVMRRHPDIKLLRKPGDIEELVKRQQAILNAMWPLLKPGGELLYATCSVLPAENEAQIEKFINNNSNVVVKEIKDIRGLKTGHGIQILPEVNDMDGFYYAMLGRLAP